MLRAPGLLLGGKEGRKSKSNSLLWTHSDWKKRCSAVPELQSGRHSPDGEAGDRKTAALSCSGTITYFHPVFRQEVFCWGLSMVYSVAVSETPCHPEVAR